MCFLFRLDLSLHAGAGIFFGILIFASKHGESSRGNNEYWQNGKQVAVVNWSIKSKHAKREAQVDVDREFLPVSGTPVGLGWPRFLVPFAVAGRRYIPKRDVTTVWRRTGAAAARLLRISIILQRLGCSTVWSVATKFHQNWLKFVGDDQYNW